MTTVTAVTTPALRADELTEQDYRDIYDELREHLSLSEFITRAGSTVSKGWWSQYEHGIKPLTLERRNELRAAVGLRILPPYPADAAGAVTDDATVYRIGDGLADRVILLTPEMATPLNLRVNGDVRVLSQFSPQNAADAEVTPVTAYRRDAPRQPRRPYRRVILQGALLAQLEAAAGNVPLRDWLRGIIKRT